MLKLFGIEEIYILLLISIFNWYIWKETQHKSVYDHLNFYNIITITLFFIGISIYYHHPYLIDSRERFELYFIVLRKIFVHFTFLSMLFELIFIIFTRKYILGISNIIVMNLCLFVNIRIFI